jgi:hypothetical protein
MFISGQSFLKETLFLLGLSDESPAPELNTIGHGLIVATHDTGLMGSREAGVILTDRARAHSRGPDQESVLLVAHGMGDDGLNEAVVLAMETVAVGIRKNGFASVRAATLREDWPDRRAEAEKSIRDYVERQSEAGRQVIVVPMRLSGVGPVADVLAGLTFAPTKGLLPHPAISDWIRYTAREVICSAGWASQIDEQCHRQ